MSIAIKRILVVGASSDLAKVLNVELERAQAVLGLHYNSNPDALKEFKESSRLAKFQKTLTHADDCHALVNDFVDWAGGIDCLIQLSGDINRSVHWLDMDEKDWDYDISANLKMPFFLAQKAFWHMRSNGGRIILMSTASARHGAGNYSRAYGVAKAGIECLVTGLAREGAPHNILVNGMAPGFIMSKFHTKRMNRTAEDIKERIKLIPLKRAGTIEEFAGAVLFLLSETAAYMTGEILTLSGGDWL